MTFYFVIIRPQKKGNFWHIKQHGVRVLIDSMSRIKLSRFRIVTDKKKAPEIQELCLVNRGLRRFCDLVRIQT